VLKDVEWISQGDKEKGENQPTSISINLRRIKRITWERNRKVIESRLVSGAAISMSFHIV
jgi:hypothetical protein